MISKDLMEKVEIYLGEREHSDNQREQSDISRKMKWFEQKQTGRNVDGEF